MPKKTTPKAETASPPSETVRMAGDLMEMARAVCFHTRDSRGKRLKIAQLLDGYVRPLLERDYANVNPVVPHPK